MPKKCEMFHLHWGVDRPAEFFLRHTCPNCSYFHIWDLCSSCARACLVYQDQVGARTPCPSCGDSYKASQVWDIYRSVIEV